MSEKTVHALEYLRDAAKSGGKQVMMCSPAAKKRLLELAKSLYSEAAHNEKTSEFRFPNGAVITIRDVPDVAVKSGLRGIDGIGKSSGAGFRRS